MCGHPKVLRIVQRFLMSPHKLVSTMVNGKSCLHTFITPGAAGVHQPQVVEEAVHDVKAVFSLGPIPLTVKHNDSS